MSKSLLICLAVLFCASPAVSQEQPWPVTQNDPAFLELTESDAATSVDDGIEVKVWPIPDALSPAGEFSSDGSYFIHLPVWARLILISTTVDNWFLQNLPYYIELKAAAMGSWFNEDREKALTLEALAKDEMRRVVRPAMLAKLKNRTLQPSHGARPAVMRRGARSSLGWGL